MKTIILTLFLSVSYCAIQAQSLSVVATNDTAICVGDTITLEAIATGGAAPYSYQWFPSDSLSCDTCSTTLAFPADSTTYMLVVTDSNAEMDTAYVTILQTTPDTLSGAGILQVQVFGNNPDIADSVVFWIDSMVINGWSWNITANGGIINSYFFSHFGNGFTVNNDNDMLHMFCQGVKTDWDCQFRLSMCFSPLNSCTSYCLDTMVLIGHQHSGIATKNSIKVNIHPNPTNDKVSIKSINNGEAEIVVYNPIGQVMLKQYSMDLIDTEVDLTTLTPGIYILHIQTKDGMAVHRIVKN